MCGAAHVAAGQTVALALPGTTIPGVGTLKKLKIREEASLGMICSEQEIGLADKSDGIWVLPDSLDLGAPLSEALGLSDSIIDIDNKSLTHRPDLWGHRGIARELSAIYRRPLLPLDVAWPAFGARGLGSRSDSPRVAVQLRRTSRLPRAMSAALLHGPHGLVVDAGAWKIARPVQGFARSRHYPNND